MGYVYLANAPNSHSMLYKIGMTTNLVRRMQKLTKEFCTPVEVIHSINVDDARGIELWFHGLFEEYQYDGEWFMLSDAHVKLWLDLARIIERAGLSVTVPLTQPALRAPQPDAREGGMHDIHCD